MSREFDEWWKFQDKVIESYVHEISRLEQINLKLQEQIEKMHKAGLGPDYTDKIYREQKEEIDRLEETLEGYQKAGLTTVSMMQSEIDRLEAENKKLKAPMEAANFNTDGMMAVGQELIDLKEELKAKDITIKLIKEHAIINFDNELLAWITEIEKDPIGFEQALKGGE